MKRNQRVQCPTYIQSNNYVSNKTRIPPNLWERAIGMVNAGGYGRPLLHAWLHPDLKQCLTTALEGIFFSSIVMVLAFRPGSNPALSLKFCRALFICFLLQTLFLRWYNDEWGC